MGEAMLKSLGMTAVAFMGYVMSRKSTFGTIKINPSVFANFRMLFLCLTFLIVLKEHYTPEPTEQEK